nr:hypothetical protein [Tanacetum cinerariifolium]
MDAKLAWLLEKHFYRSQTHTDCLSSQANLYFTEKELHQLHLDKEALRESLEENTIDEKARKEKIRQKQAEDDELFLEFEVLSSSTRVKPSPSTPNPVRIIPGPAGIVQQAKLLKERDILLGWDMAWISATEYVNANDGTVIGCLGDIDNNLKKGKLDKVVEIVKSCSPNDYGDLTVTMKDPSGAAMILANVLVFSPKPSMHYLNIIKKNVVKVFRKDTVPGSGSS